MRVSKSNHHEAIHNKFTYWKEQKKPDLWESNPLGEDNFTESHSPAVRAPARTKK
jgi:hypothetical protein